MEVSELCKSAHSHARKGTRDISRHKGLNCTRLLLRSSLEAYILHGCVSTCELCKCPKAKGCLHKDNLPTCAFGSRACVPPPVAFFPIPKGISVWMPSNT